MVIYRESGVELVQARGEEGRFQYMGDSMRLGAFAEGESWYIGVHRTNGGLVARLSLEDARTLKEAKDMLKYGFFLQIADNIDIIRQLEQLGMISAPALAELNRN
jgi:hypothetical protein